MSMTKILVADEVSESGLQPLRDADFTVEKQTGISPSALVVALSGCQGLVVRSETKVTAQVMDAATELRVIGRAGVGVDNIDVSAATARGIVVMNAPDGNTITTAEHTIALLIALARNVPQANSSLKSGKWARKSFIGVELAGKTLGIVGLGRIGRAVASRARAFGMKVVSFDPFIAPEQARDLEIEVAPLDEVFARADFLTVHTPLTAETRGIVGQAAFARMKRTTETANAPRPIADVARQQMIVLQTRNGIRRLARSLIASILVSATRRSAEGDALNVARDPVGELLPVSGLQGQRACHCGQRPPTE